jgi:hypothetical protein
LKASNTDADDSFGLSSAISGDTVVVGAFREDSASAGVDADQADNSALDAGAAYVFARQPGGTVWTQQNYLKPSITAASQRLGVAVAISDGTLVAGATGVSSNSGAAFVFAAASCAADLTGDGAVGFDDFLAFFNCYDIGDLCGDVDGSLEVDFGDFLAFFNGYDTACGQV